MSAASSSDRVEAGSGRFVIGPVERSLTLLPPRGEAADDILSLDSLGAKELTADEHEAEVARTVSEVVPSGQGGAGEAELAPGFDWLKPYYGNVEQKGERVELDLEDLSLSPDNPYAASSLVPPARPPVRIANVFAALGAALALGAAGFWLYQHVPASSQAHAVRRVTVETFAAPSPAPVAAVSAPAATRSPQLETAVASEPEPSAKPAREQTVLELANPAAAQPQPAPARVATRAQQAEARAQDRAAVSKPMGPSVSQHPAATTPAGGTAQAALAAVLGHEAPVAKPEPPAPLQAPADQAETPAPQSLGALPEQLTREQVVAGFGAVRDAIDGCAAGKHGVAQINASIANTGRVAYALIAGKFAGTPEGSCMARAVRAAQFPRFAGNSLKVSYPIEL